MRSGWVPNQHGAWAMLVGPAGIGVALRASHGSPRWTVPLLACWVIGYFAFHASSLVIKAAPRRRRRYLPPALTYALACLGCGLTTLLLGGWALLEWVPVYVVLLGAALWLTARHRERSLASGVATVTAACLMFAIVRWDTPSTWVDAGRSRDGVVGMLVWLYFLGTLVYVKTMIRERGRRTWLIGSLVWHVLCLGAAIALVAAGMCSPWWPVVFGLGLIRAAGAPAIAARGVRLSPAAVGMAEAVLVALVIVAGLA